MSKKRKYRKKVPQPPYYWLLVSDGCWDCNCNRNGCGGCKRLKEQQDDERKLRDRKIKEKLRRGDYEGL